ncbi:MAG: hypothetical protein OEW06_06090 [Gemmatimonadota bacterium]|nr:hypothetical protein [Gemmatimonadota bacterium]
MAPRSWILCLLVTASRPALSQETFDYDRRLGLAFPSEHDSICLTIHAPGLQPGTRLMLVDDRDSAAVVPAVVRAARSSSCPREVPGLGDAFYSVTTSGPVRLQPGGVVVAVVGDGLALSAGADGVSGDLDGDGIPEYFRQCTSTEGLHFTVWSGRPLRGDRRWHRYFFLGYDVEPSCIEAEYRP